jgi:periplasmic protein TonB
MIRRSTAIATAALLLSLLIHLLGLNLSWRVLPEQGSGRQDPEVIELGNAFEDIAQPLSGPVAPELAPVPEPPVATPPEPDKTDIPTSQALVASSSPLSTVAPDTGSAKAVQPGSPASPAPEQSETPEPETVAPAGVAEDAAAAAAVTSPVKPPASAVGPESRSESVVAEPVPAPSDPAATKPDGSQMLAALPAPTRPVAPVPAPSTVPVSPVEPDAVKSDPPVTEAGEAEASDLAVLSSPRPQLPNSRPSSDASGSAEALETGNTLASPSQSIESPLTAYQRDGTDLTVGQGRGTVSSGLGFEGSGGPGNSDVTNYAGRILVHLNRAPVVPVSGRGAARVFFVINPDGTLASVDVFDSAGSKDIIRAAKEQIRIAAPFPPPPNGSSRSLSFIYRVK